MSTSYTHTGPTVGCSSQSSCSKEESSSCQGIPKHSLNRVLRTLVLMKVNSYHIKYFIRTEDSDKEWYWHSVDSENYLMDDNYLYRGVGGWT